MDKRLKSLVKKREELGWSRNDLADKTCIPYDVLLRTEKGSGRYEDYLQRIESILNKELGLLYTKWSQKYDWCVKCGTTQDKHVARGLCKNCYDSYIEKRHRGIARTQNYGASSKLLTEEYLIENYIKQNKSLADIAKETNCSRQYVHKKLKIFGIPLRSKSDARDLALTKDKLKFERLNDDGTSSFILLKKINVNEDYFSSWSSSMAYVLGVIYTDGNIDPGRIREPWRAKSSTVPRISIAQKEPELLEKILHLMDCNAKLYFHKERVYGKTKAGALYHCQIANEKLYDDIVNLGLTPSKSVSCEEDKKS